MLHCLLRLLAFISLFLATQGLPDPITSGNSYLLSSDVTGDNFYLGCGGNDQCSILNISAAQLHDGWTAIDNGDGTWGFQSHIDHNWALAVYTDDYSIFADTSVSTSSPDQRWTLNNWPDGTYQLHNSFGKGNLDVKNNETPFINNYTGDASNLLGQRWYFRSVAPQTTVTSTTTATLMVNTAASSTTTTTITTCLGKVSWRLVRNEKIEVLTLFRREKRLKHHTS